MFVFVYLCIYKYLNPLHMVKVSRRHLLKEQWLRLNLRVHIYMNKSTSSKLVYGIVKM